MTGKELLTILCKYINEELHITAIKGPSNNPAPVITPYVTVYLQNVRQVGDRMIPGPVHGGQRKSKAYMKVATVQFYEVEGDGEAMRSIQNALQSDEFDAFVEANVEPRDDGLDAGFSVWEIGDVVDNGFQDGIFFIQQKTMTADFQFFDYEEHTTQRIESVNGLIGPDARRNVVTDDGRIAVNENGAHVVFDDDSNKEQLHVEVNDG